METTGGQYALLTTRFNTHSSSHWPVHSFLISNTWQTFPRPFSEPFRHLASWTLISPGSSPAGAPLSLSISWTFTCGECLRVWAPNSPLFRLSRWLPSAVISSLFADMPSIYIWLHRSVYFVKFHWAKHLWFMHSFIWLRLQSFFFFFLREKSKKREKGEKLLWYTP